MTDLSTRLESLSREERAALVQLLRKKKESSVAPPPPPSRAARRDLPLSFAQQRLWFLDRLAPGNPVYNISGILRLLGRLDVAVLAACLNEVVRRHDSLRTRFEIRGDGPVQVIEPPAPLPLPMIDLSALPADIRAPEEERVAFERENAPFDLSRPPLLQACLIRLGAEEHLFIHVLHHIASDGWSLEVAVGEVSALYPAFLAGQPSPLPELPLQYADFAWQQLQTLQGETLAREIGFWRERLAGAAPLELPADRPRPPVSSFRGNKVEVPLPPSVEAGLRQVAREQRATPFMAVLAPLSAFLGRIAGSDDVVLGTVVTGRDRRDIANLIGFFVNTLILRFDLSGDPDGRALLAQAREVVLEAFAHQTLPFEKLVDELGLPRDPYRQPLLRVVSQLLAVGRISEELPGITLERYTLPDETAKFDLVINAADQPDGLRLEWRYDADLFDASTIQRWSGLFETLVGGWLEDPARRVAELPLLTEAEQLQLLTASSPAPSTADQADRGRRVLSALFEAQVDRTPDAPAVSFDQDAGLTYRELDERANRISRWLVEAGTVPGDRVALCLDRSPDLVAAVLGVLKTGAAYVPLDPSSPSERLAFAREDSGASLLLDAAWLEREVDAIARQSGERLGWDLDPELPAYVIYTSGSTGRPKGVIVPHGAVARLLTATAPWFDFGPDDVWTLFHSYAFDFSVWEIWGALLHGGRLVVVPHAVTRDPAAFLDLLLREGVTVLNQTPSAFHQLLSAQAQTSLRLVIFGGEALDPTMLAPWFARHGDERPRMVNMYGITETTVHVTYRPLAREDSLRTASRIGRPIPDLALHVLDRRLQLQPAGVPGEICVGGEGLAHGYLGRPDLTAMRFVPDPYGPAGSRLYRSGDLARRRPDGDLEFLGRIDHQVKIRGFRIELGEIEAAITAHPGVREAVVLALQDSLVAYLTVEPDEAPPTLAELRGGLADRLPDYMLPSALVVLDRLPLTTNGKVDRRALPAPEAVPSTASGPAHMPPRDVLETDLAGLFRRVLNVPAEREIGVLDNFFELGGSSISGAVLINLLQEILGEIVHVVVIFDHPTVESLAAYVREQHAAAAARVWSGTAPVAVEGESPAGQSDVHEILRLIVEGRPEQDVEEVEEPANPPAVLILSPPRSGSTLLRVMLGAHPRLFAPPELELLSFKTMAGRHAAFSGRDSFWLEGVVRAVMEARSCDAAEAERIVAAGESEGWTTRRFYRELQGWIGDRLLVDKTPSYALDPAVLRRAERWFAGARYIHLVRHPQAANRSFEEARLDQIFFRRPHRFSRARLAELIWTVSHRHILDFLAEVPAERRHTVRFEELVREPERVLAAACDFLGLELDPAMVDPYRGGAARMVDGVHAVSRMLGDVKLLAHGKVDASVAERWRQEGGAPLGGPALAVAAELGYELARGAWEESGTAPVSFAQERLWLLEQLLPGTPTYNVPGAIRLRGRLDVAALARVVGEIVRRHAALRTIFASEAGQPVQKILPVGFPSSRPLPVIDLSALPEEARDAEAVRRAAAEATLPFDLERGPLFRTALVRLGPREHVALYTMHHIVSDGWSMGVFYSEVAALYQAFARGLPSPLPELRLQYPDYALRQRSRVGLAREIAWWKERLTGIEPLELPTDRPRPAVRSGRGAGVSILFRPELSLGLTALGRGERATLYMVLLAAFQGFLQRLARQDDVAVGSPVAHRSSRDVEELIGFFVNTLVMRTDVSGDPAFRELLVRVRRTVLDALLHQDAPFERVVEAVQPERQLSRSPLFQVMFSLQNAGVSSVEISGLTLEEAHASTETAKFDLTLLLDESPEGLAATLEYDLDLFEEATAARLLRHLGTLMEGAVASPDARLSELPLLTPEERSVIVTAWNGAPASGAPYRRALPGWFEEQVDRTPDAPAVSLDGGHLTYGALDDRAEALAWHLRALGVLPGDRVALCFDRSLETIVAILGALKAGAAYVPLDPSYPRERVAFALEDSGAVLVLTSADQAEALPATAVRTVLVDREVPAAGRPAGRRLGLPLDPELPAYVIYTSGSTGRPKGVVVPHGNVTRLFGSTQHWFGFGPQDVWTLFHSYAFDFSVWEIWGALLYGGRLVVVPYWVSREPEAFWRLLGEERVTVLSQTPSAFRQLLWAEKREGAEPPLRHVIFGGEALDPSMLAPWFSSHGDERPRLINMYGITETTVHVTYRPLTSGDTYRSGSRVGEPIQDLTVHVLDRTLEPQPLGVPGEICVGGQGLAHGYLDRPDLTAERFVPDPFGPAGARLYRSGDLARRLPDGDLEYLGRIDFQVKIRGFRIELGEIEAALAAHPEVTEAAVLVRGEGSDQRLVAYVASDGVEDLRHWLAGRIPEPMIPADFVELPKLPLTSNGKVDRRALAKIAPEPSAARHGDHVLPRTPVEETLAGLFVEVLGEERTGGRVGIHDHFFELGGHSLAAARLVSRLRAALGVELPLRTLFETPTVAGLAGLCSVSAEAAPELPLVPAPRDPAGEPLSFAQERLWFLERLTPGTSAFNLPVRTRLRGPLDPARLARCLGEVCRRHESLRTRFTLRAGAPVQVVDPPSPFLLPVVDLSGLPAEVRSGEAERHSAGEAEQPFDLERGSLLRALLLRLEPAEHGLFLTVHHIVSDGWSLEILFRELVVLYEAFAAGRPSPLPELPVQVADVARWQRERLRRGPALEAQLAWWRERLGGAPEPLDLPLDRARPAVQTFRGAVHSWLLPAGLSSRLRSLAHGEGASLFMALLAGLDLLLARWSGQDDILVGTPMAGRHRPELEDLIGLFLNNLVLRVDLSGRQTGRALVARAREAALGAYANQDIPFEKLLQDLQPERDLSRTPLFQVFLNMLNFPEGGASLPDGLVLEPLGGAGVDSKFDLTLYASEADAGISLLLAYSSDLFDQARMEELLRQLQSVLEQLAAAPDAPIDAISLLTPEAAALLPDPRQPLDTAWVGSVHELFAEHARRAPDRLAVGGWTYGELSSATARLAALLRREGVASQDPVAIWAERDASLVWAVMGVLWAGGAFVILDPAYPPARLAETIRLASPRYFIQSGIEIAGAGALPAEVEEALTELATAGALRGRVRLSDEILASLPAPVPPAPVGPDDLALIAFTSGSTGTPKGIAGRHGPLSHFLPFQRERFGLGEAERFSLLSGLSHDPLQRDIFTPLCLGGTVCVPAADDISPGRLAAWMAREGITLAHLTPAMGQLLTEGSSGVEIPTLRWVLLVGDVLTRLDVDRLRRLAPRVTCVNLYGSTETQRSVAYHVVEESEIADPRAPQVLPLGRGMRDVQLLVVSRGTQELAGVGEVGEIWMRSPHLARGYLGDEALTRERFIPNPFFDQTDPTDPTDRSDRIYRTGDLGRYRPDGEATFAGRADQQVKIRGFRIELGEIEAALGRQPGVREAVVLAPEIRPGDRHLVAYVTGDDLDGAVLRDALRTRLPAYMVPSAFVLLAELPVTPNGKVDRRALSQIAPERSTDDYVAPRTATEETLAGLWAELLGAEWIGDRGVGVHDNFFALGGHSLLATRLLAAVRDLFGVDLPLRTVFERPALEEIARAIDAAERPEVLPAEAPGPAPAVPQGPAPLSFSQERLWFLDQMAPGTTAYNMAGAFRLRGSLDVAALRGSVAEIVRRHDALRTTFDTVEGLPVQRVEPFDPERPVARMPLVDLSTLPEPARSAEAEALGLQEARSPFDLATGPLFRVFLLRLAAGDHIALFTMHHIISDGWSMTVFYREVGLLYEAFSAGRPSPLAELPLQYVDHARRQRERLEGPALQRGLAEWRRILDGVPPLELPADRPRPAARSWRGDTLPVVLGSAATRELHACARGERATLFMGLLALFQTFLHRLSNLDDIAVGTAVANRGERATEGLIGFFVNSLVLRTDLSGNPTVREAVRRARRTSLEAFQLQEIPFEKVVEEVQPERHTSRTPLFQVMLLLQNVPSQAVPLPGLVLEPVPAPKGTAKFDLTLNLTEMPDGLSGSLEYDLDLFDPVTAERMLGHFQTLLAAVAADPGARIGEIPLLSVEERGQLAAWNHTAAEIPPVGLHELIEAQVARTPDAVAAEDLAGGRLTYRDLDERAERLALSLERLGVGPEALVGISLDRSVDLLVALLAVLKAGGGYLPLDPDLPRERLDYMQADSGVRLVLTRERLNSLLAAEETGRRRRSPVFPDQTAYVLYTSGSTGRPKGVQVVHSALVNFLLSMSRRPGLRPDDTLLAITTLSFDIAALELYLPLVVGARVCIASREVANDGALLARALEAPPSEKITTLQATPATWRMLFAAGWTGRPDLVALCGGEALPRDLADRLLASTGALWNVYGPTETTIWSTVGEVRGTGPISIGRPLANTRIEVLSPALEPVPVGVPGELCIAGAGLARGYLGRPELTSDRFVPDRSGETGARLYRTGDLARWLPDGRLECLGRIDTQVKVRGFRIELGEIEAVLGRIPGVREAAVLVREEGGERSLAAYVVPAEEAGPDPGALRDVLRTTLPDYMVPSAFVMLDRLPLTPSRKVDRKALLQIVPERTAGAGHVAPRTPVEETLASLFVEVLGMERTGGRVGVHDSFFELGGHSLLATRLIAALREALQVELPLRIVFERPTVAGLAAAIAGAGEAGAPVDEPVVPVPREPGVNRFPVSFSQLREWILDRLEPGNPAYNIPNNLRIEGPLSIPVLAEALRRLVQRHEVLRTAFEAGDDEPLQVVFPEAALELPVIDLSALPEEAREAELWRRVRHLADTGFDLTEAPLFRARAVRLGADDHALLTTVHHIVSDGWSISILNQELAALYEAAASGTSPLPPLPVQYADYAIWQRARLDPETLERQAGYWRRQLAGAPPLLELPTDRPRPPVRSGRGSKLPFQLPRPLTDRMEEVARRNGATLFMVLLAGYQTLLARWSGQDDVVTGTYSGNRPRRELEGLIGFFINTLVLRTHLMGDPSFAGLVRRVRETTLGAYAHRDLPFEKLLEALELARDPSRTPLFQAHLVFQNFPPTRADLSTGVRLTSLPVLAEKADYDLALWVAEGPEGLGGNLEYSSDLFDESTVERFAAQLQTLLEAAVADPARNVWTLPLVSEEEQARQLAAWSRGPAVPDGPTLLHRLVEEQAARTPTAVAVEAGSVRLTYADLVEQARRVAGGIDPGTIVALAAERTPELIVNLLAVLQAGAAYLPVDPGYPQERREYMLEDSGAKDIKVTKDDKSSSPLMSLVSLPSLEDAPAYLIYTSGSTGRPKGVLVPHRAIASFVRAARETYEIGPGDRVLQFASLSFDTSAEEIWPTLASGATLVLRPEEMAASIPHFLRELERLGITCLDLPTAFWHEMVAGMEAENLELPRGLRLVILGGEEALADRFALWQRRVGSSVRLVNTYGPTETTIVATRRELTDLLPGSTIPIGRPIPGAQAYVLDRFLAPVPPGVRGELWIGGAGVAQGYLGRPALTADRFRPDLFAEERGARLYRTGDLAILTPDGDLVFAGRADRQLKIRGYRIEPGEVEAALRLHPAVRDAVVDAHGDRDDRRLIAWIVPHEGIEAPGALDLRAFLRERLPEPLLPAVFVMFEPGSALPLTPSGKVDRRALPEPAEARSGGLEGVAFAEPQSAMERTIAEVYRDLLRVGRVGLHDNFFDLGGHSLLLVRAHQRLKEALGKEIPVLDLFRFPTVAGLARHLGGEEADSLQKVQGLAEQQRGAQQRQKTVMERLRRPGRKG